MTSPDEPNSPTPLDDRQIAERLAYLGFVSDDAELLRSLRKWAEDVADGFLGKFYDEQFSYPEFVTIVSAAGSSRERLVETQRKYFLQLFCGMPDGDYVASRLRIGQVHARLKITPRWYVSSYELHDRILNPMLRTHFRLQPAKYRRALAALGKLLQFDQGLVLDQYVEGVTDEVRSMTLLRAATEIHESADELNQISRRDEDAGTT